MNYELGFYLNPHFKERQAVMKALAKHNIKWVGIDGSSWRPEEDKTDILEFKSELSALNLSLFAMHSALPLLATPGESLPDELFQQQVQELQKGALLECQRVIYHFCLFRDCPFEESDNAIEAAGKEVFLQNYANAVNNVAAVAKTMNIVPVIENVYVSSFSESFELLKRIIATSGADNAGICIDTGHAFLADNDPADKIRQAGELLMDTHFHDNFGKTTSLPSVAYSRPEAYRHDLHLPPGMGTINWCEVCKALLEVNYSGPIMFEGVLGPGDDLQKGCFAGKLSYSDIVKLTIDNWRAFELLTG
jgi:sugar phosphate isomerase/epimerase